MREKNRVRRNRCALTALVLYGSINAIGLATLRTPGNFQFHYGAFFALAWTVVGFMIVGLLVAFCCFGARVRGYSGWAGLMIALIGLFFYFGAAIYLLFQNVNKPFSLENPARVDDDRTRLLLPIAFAVAALLLGALRRRNVNETAISQANV